ncbi:MAG: tetratricopeptide repeat protein [Chthoniobacterales bacterium]
MRKSLILLLLVLVTFAVYAPALRNEIVWDDTALILRDPLIRSWRLIPEAFQHFLFTDATASDFYRPIQRLTYTLDYAAHGVRPFGYHFTSIACHAAAALALFFLATELLRYFGADERRTRWAAFGAALVWAIHPVHSGAVAYISGRADPLAAGFGFAGLALALVSSRVAGARQWLLTISAAAAMLLSALSKEAGLIFLALWLAVTLLAKDWQHATRAAVGCLFVVAIYLSLRLPAEHIPPPSIRAPAPLLVRPILVARAFAEYTYLIFAPVNLHMERDVETHPTGFNNESLTNASWREFETLAGILLMAAFIYWLVRERKRDRAVFTCLILAAIAYLPVSGAFPLNASIAEHWLYLPSAFLFIALALCLCRLTAREERQRSWIAPATYSLLAIWILFLGVRCFVRTFDWEDQRTFFESAIRDGGNTPRMLINLAGVEMNEERLDDAKAHLRQALKMEPDQPLALINLAGVAVKQSDFPAAHQLLTRAKDMPLVEAQAYELLSVLAYKESGKVELLRLRLASRTGPPNWSIEKRYIKLLDESGNTDAAIRELQQCLQTQWYRAESWQLFAQLLRKAGRTAEAESALAQAHRYDVRLDARPAVL